ncbi:unnamed protein product [Symbiodinium sp. KB8]|nr:unnamed protein product [Symbiodinium sp. KB8]
MPADINHQSSSISSQSSRKVNKDPLCKPVTDALDYFFNETVFGGSLAAEFGALFNFLFGHVMFWAVGLPTMLDYGFEETRNGPNDVTPSGLKGSGAFIVTLVLMVIATVIFVTKMYYQFGIVSERLQAKAAAEEAHRERMAKLRNARSAQAAGTGAAAE